MRLLGIMALCLVLIAGLIFGYDRRNEIVERIADQFEGTLLDDYAIIDATPDQLPVPNAGEGLMIIPMQEAGALNSMIGYPSFGRATFDMPGTGSPRTGEVVLEFSGAQHIDAEGVLRVSVNGIRRAVKLLDSGQLHRRVIVPLNSRDLSSDQLTVALSLDGRAPEVECTVDWVGGVALQILPRSYLRLIMSEPVQAPADLLLMAGSRPSIDWPVGDHNQQAQRFVQAYKLGRRTDDVTFAADPARAADLSSEDLAVLIAATAPTLVKDNLDPADLAATLGLQRSREFEGETRWRITFDQSNFDEAIRAIQLTLTLGSVTSAEEPWLVVAKLNDRLLFSESLVSADGQFDQNISIPQNLLMDQNVLTLSLRHTAQLDGPCPSGVPAVAEVTKLTLVTNGDKPTNAYADLVQLIGDPIKVTLGDNIGPLEAQVALDTVTLLAARTQPLPLTAESTATGDLSVRVVGRDHLNAVLSTLENGKHWVAVVSDTIRNDLEIVAVTPIVKVDTNTLPRAVLVISDTSGALN
ncbi:MAG: hypothetical protein ABJM65_00580 [Ascidiaceihabitans sp.]|uniref:hypothetical protein n=1 Tax=Ascidiaceihabitans sp. TaxID=1872644 RepID=UPI003298706B